MFNFHLVDVIHILWMLDFYERSKVYSSADTVAKPGSLAALGTSPAFFHADISAPDKANAKTIIDSVNKLAASLGLKTTQHRLEVFELDMRYPTTEAEYKNHIKVLRDALKHDLTQCRFYHYPQSKFDVLMSYYPQWNKINTAFPDAKSESLASVDCYAMGQNTASVFHIMRVAEHGLRALAKERRLQLPRRKPIDWATWQEVIRELTKEAAKIGDKAKAGSAKDSALSFYSGAISDLNAFKDEYRNQVMHVRDSYDEHQALRALTKVHAFMDRLADKLNHKHKRIRWGLKYG